MRALSPGLPALAPGLVLGLLLGLSGPAPARADAVPTLDIESTCRSAQAADASVSDRASYDGCLRSERDARRQAEQHWGEYSATAKTQCREQFKAGGYPSYVEMITCLELASGTVPTQPGDGSPGVGGPGAPRDAKARREGAQNLTREPPASQRTDPIEVLEGK